MPLFADIRRGHYDVDLNWFELLKERVPLHGGSFCSTHRWLAWQKTSPNACARILGYL